MNREFELRRADAEGSKSPKSGARPHLPIGMDRFVVETHALSAEQFAADVFNARLKAGLDRSQEPISIVLPTAGKNGEKTYLDGVLDSASFNYKEGDTCEFRIKSQNQTVSVCLALQPGLKSTAKPVKEPSELKII